MKQSITLLEVYRFIDTSYKQIHKNDIMTTAIYDKFSQPERIPYNDGGFSQYEDESDYPNACEAYCSGCNDEDSTAYEQMTILMELFEIDDDLESDYQKYIWGEAKDIQTIISKEAKVFAQELYDEMDTARKIKHKEKEISDEEFNRRYDEELIENPNKYSHCLECGMVGGYCNPCKFEDEYTKTTTITRKFWVSKQ